MFYNLAAFYDKEKEKKLSDFCDFLVLLLFLAQTEFMMV